VMGMDEGKKMSKNSKLQNTNYKQITNYKLQITKKMAHELHELTRISEKKETIITKTKDGHGLHKDSSRLQTMTAFNEKLLRGVQGGGFLEKSPPGKKKVRNG
jgi:hypothetical protein